LSRSSPVLSATTEQKDLLLLGFVAAALFVIAFLINATNTSTKRGLLPH
jgi:hypothetical protein